MIRFVSAACGGDLAVNVKCMDVMVADLIDVVQENSQEDDRKAKKPMQGEEEDSKEGSDEEDRESEESDNESL